MGDLSKHFDRSEFECRCGCGKNTVDFELVMLLEHLRSHFVQPITINSGCRCEAHNILVGGSTNSQHVLGKAADIVVEGHDAASVCKFVEEVYPDKYGVGCYHTFTHIDVRPELARWKEGGYGDK